MEFLSLSQLFGEGTTQTPNTLSISKAGLVGLTASANNTAESLLVGILLTALANFQGVITDENNQPITDENDQAIAYDNSESFELLKLIAWSPFTAARNSQPYIFHQLIVFRYENTD
jgi:hypothetical protein